jgi:preprotein translocase subunit YajC
VDPTALIFLALAGAAFYFLIIRPGKQRQQQQARLIAGLRPGAEIMTTAGIFGTVAVVTDDEISVQISPGVFLRLLPAAVARVIETPVEEMADEEPPVD